MNIAVDFGNTSAKVGIFKDDILHDRLFFHDTDELKSFLEKTPTENIIVSSVTIPPSEVLTWCSVTDKKIALTTTLPLPVTILYQTPLTLGVDRIAAVCGALRLYPKQDCLVIDAGTCINYEFVDSTKHYHGGAISPGVTMRFDSMNYFTARLPLVQPVDHIGLIGNSTETCLQSGVINGSRAEVNGIIQKYRAAYPGLKVLLCGGDAHYFGDVDETIQTAPDLVLIGLGTIMSYLIA